MPTMYEMIMDLPLFKGIGRDQVSALLERNHIVFGSYEPGAEIAVEGDNCGSIGFIIRGEVDVVRKSTDGSLSLSYTLRPGSVIGADSLFGWCTQYVCSCMARDKVSVLTFTKEQYLRLLSFDDIYIINALNYLSRGLQWARLAATEFNAPGILNTIARWVLALTDQSSHNIKVHFPRLLTAGEVSECEPLEKEGILAVEEGRIKVLDVRRFYETLSGEA